MKRSSRNVVISKAMRYVDEETRREHRERRLQSLECDNYMESELTGQVDGKDGDEYDEEERDVGPKAKKKRLATVSKSSNKWASRAVKPLERLLLDNGIVPSMAGSVGMEVNYYSAMALPSVYPPRQCFCSVCGYLSNYSCVRCGSKYCSIKCNEHHKETKCFKISM